MPVECIWIGGAPTKVAQVETYTPASVQAGDTIRFSINGRTLSSYTIGATPTVASVCAGIAANWSTAGIAEAEDLIDLTDNTTHVTVESLVEGEEFAIDVAKTGGGTTTITRALVTASAGPDHANDARNWLHGAVPADGDSMRFPAGCPACRQGLDLDVDLTSCFSEPGAGEIGRPAWRIIPAETGGGFYTVPENRRRLLKVLPERLWIGLGDPSLYELQSQQNWSNPQRFDCDGAAVKAVCYGPTGFDVVEPRVQLILNDAAAECDVLAGDVSLLAPDGGTLTAAVVRVGNHLGLGRRPRVVSYSSLAIDLLKVSGGHAVLAEAPAEIEVSDGGLCVVVDGDVPSAKAWGEGVFRYHGGGEVTFEGSGEFDFRAILKDRTVANARLYRGARVRDPAQSIAVWDNPIELVGCTLQEVTLDCGPSPTFSFA